MKNSNDTIGNRSRDLPGCSAVPQPLRHRVPRLLKDLSEIPFQMISMYFRWEMLRFLKFGALKPYITQGREYNVYPKATFHIYCPISVKIGVEGVDKMPFSICNFHENRQREGRTFLIRFN
jgi:hypothetical protein